MFSFGSGAEQAMSSNYAYIQILIKCGVITYQTEKLKFAENFR